ncbi:MAG TPA: AAA family ATPase, partial [Bryobacteraceae bacterium]
ILFDEIEKANDALWNLLLGILDKATLTLGDNRRVDFSRAMIFMTSNLGAREMNNLVNTRMGFPGATIEGNELNEKLADTGLEAARRKFTPEFMNRIDKVVVYKSLDEAQLRTILDIEINQVQNRILLSPADRPFVVSVTDQAKELLLSEGTDVKYGARPLKRAIERLITLPLSRLLSTGQIQKSDYVRVDRNEDRLVFHRMPREALVA